MLVIGQTSLESLRDISLTPGRISDPYLSSSASHGLHCLSHYFAWLAKPALEKQTSQTSVVMQQLVMDSSDMIVVIS